MPEFCGYGGYCMRLAGHTGACTKAPPPGTQAYDREQAERLLLAELDFDTPWWADLRDPL